MNFNRYCFAGGLVVSSLSAAAAPFSESLLVETYAKESLSRGVYEIQDLRGVDQYESQRSHFSPTFNAQSQVLNSNKDSISAFQPTLQKSRSWDLNIQKAWAVGLRSKIGFASNYTDLRFSPQNIISHEPTLYAEISLSLLQNLLGRADRARIRGAHDQRALSEIQNRIAFRQGLQRNRILYWTLLANNSFKNISEGMLGSARKQLQEIEARQKSAISERADVLLSRSQVAQREAALISVRLREQTLSKELLSEMPSLSHVMPLKYPNINIDAMIEEVGACLSLIQSRPETPLDFTSYAEVFPLLDGLEDQAADTAGIGIGPEIFALGRVESNGVDRQFREGVSEMRSLSKNTWSAGLQLRVPLDASEYRAKNSRERIAQLEIAQQRAQLRRLIDATHSSALESIAQLLKSISNLTSSTALLKERIESVNTKFRQGRVELLSLVQEQDQLFGAEGSLIESRLLFLQELLSYFMVFDRTPCSFNLQHDKALKAPGI
jgi:outer membrane protein TolC